MRCFLLSLLWAILVLPVRASAQTTATAEVRFVVPEANALGQSVAVYANTVALGTLDPEAYVFQLDQGRWWMDRLVSPVGPATFKAVAISEDVAVVGTYSDAFIYRFNGTSWVYEKTLTHGGGNRGFGLTVDVDHDLAVVGKRSTDVEVFRFVGGDWVSEARFAPPPLPGKTAPYGFAEQVVVDEDRVLVRKSSTIGDEFEGVYAYRYDGTRWYHEGTITLSDTETVFQGAIALDGDVALIDADYDDVVHVFRFDGAAWEREAILAPPTLDNRNCSCLPIPAGDREFCDGDNTPNFGVSVAVDGELALVGANLDDVLGVDSGAAYLYRYDGAEWRYELMLQGEATVSCGADFGRLVALHDGRAVVRQGHSAYFFRIPSPSE